MALTKNEREAIRNKLPHGSQSRIAESIGCSRMAICHYLNGKIDNIQIEEALVIKFHEITSKEKELKKIFNESQSI